MILFFVSLGVSQSASAQESKSKSGVHHFDGIITATNNGISIIPSFTLGRPAVFFDLSIGGERLSFDPMLRFGMDGKPWTFVFWGRYKVIKDKRFSLTLGGHPAFLFQEVDMVVQGKPDKMLVANRYLAGEITTSYKLSDRVSTGIYFLKGTGLKVLGTKNTDFLAWNTSVTNLKLVNDLALRVNSQLFFLRTDDTSGMYINSGFTFEKGGFPIQFQGFFNRKIKSTVPGDDLVWNLSLLYTFSNTFSKK
ncbi:hypothetical protein [Algoriphagus sp.]|uniref:hypothetical protein n=1 Tax=Algoriphagus sp. TaxID=1872435 RepID=UPI002720B5D8|nr:hypothetical protein [Algoriphagus sp.]MDO8966687.1 hypothetical protein [Algoriphagus sp.]